MADSIYKPFYLDEYLLKIHGKTKKNERLFSYSLDKNTRFQELCENIKMSFKEEWNNEQSIKGEHTEILLERQKKAIIGYTTEVNYYKDKINEYLREYKLKDEWFPDWYQNLSDAIFHENWGLAGIAAWKNLKESSSAKIIGERIYFFINGKEVLQEQKISKTRFEQMRKALLLNTPKKRLDETYSEVYMLSGERISIYNGDITYKDQDVMVFRNYIVDKLTFEEQASRGTIPFDMIPFLKAKVKTGFNIYLVGPVRTAKTTFLQTYWSYEDQTLEGVLIQTDPEIAIHKIMPKAPIMSIIAKGKDMIETSSYVLRSDADYIVVGEGRDGYSLNMSVEAANKGTRRCKGTMHLTEVEDFCYDVANKIVQVYGGNLDYTIAKVAKSFDYIYEFCSLPKDKSKKRLKGLYEIRYDKKEHKITIHQICKYNVELDNWTFKYDIGKDKEIAAKFEDAAAFKIFDSELKKLSEKYPMIEDNIFTPIYSKVGV